jgi:NAD(P)H-flavin reductase
VEAARGRDLIIVAGGIGLAPLRPAILHAIRHRDDFASVTLLYGARTPEDLLYRYYFDRWRQSGLRIEVTVDRAERGWTEHVGVVTPLINEVSFDGDGAVAVMCGPEIMMRFCARELAREGLSSDRIHLSMERNMRCALGHCGHCMLGPHFVCRDGPVLPLSRLEGLMEVREL